MALTIRNISEQQIELAKELTGQGTASSALVACVELAAEKHKKVVEYSEYVGELHRELGKLYALIDRAQESAAAFSVALAPLDSVRAQESQASFEKAHQAEPEQVRQGNLPAYRHL